MDKNQILEFIKTSKANGLSDENIRTTLQLNGWSDTDIKAVLLPTSKPVVENKKQPSTSHRKKIIITAIILIALVIVFRVIKLPQRALYSNDSPYLETCIQSNNFIQDATTGNSLKYVECMKGYSHISGGFSGGESIVSEVTGGYVISDKNGKTISIIQANQHSNGGPRSGVSPDGHFIDNNFFINATNDQSGVLENNQLSEFDGNAVKQLGQLPFDARQDIIIYDNSEVYYHDYVGNVISKYDLATGQSTKIVDLSNIPRDSFYTNVYKINGIKNDRGLLMVFGIITSYNSTTSHQQWAYYTLDLTTGQVQKDPTEMADRIKTNNTIIPVKYSLTSGTAETYGLQYITNPDMNIYQDLLATHHAEIWHYTQHSNQ
ncbi:MAG: hypothetical protein JWM92_311 [Candidatus Nomurabacteria bacterium]|nr:hypothetical protein [Candidatus Nomurabacteria bacterium]